MTRSGAVRGGVVVVVLWCLSVLLTPTALADVSSPDPASPEGQAIVAPATADAVAQLGKPAQLEVRSLKAADGWAFLWSAIQGPDGQPIDYAGTPFAEAAAAGGKSKKYVALLQADDHGWNLIQSALGPTDVAWTNWSAQYGAPPAIFEIPVY